MEILVFIAWIALCVVAAYIAGNKGRSGPGIFFLSLFLSPLIGIIVALVLSPDPTAQGKKKCPECAEFVQPDARTCRFCQHSFVEEEAAERVRLEDARAELEATRTRQQAEYEAMQAVEASKPWLARYRTILVFFALILGVLGVTEWYGYKHSPEPHSPGGTSVESKSLPPEWATDERTRMPKSVWDKKIQWAIQHHCYFTAMSKEEIVQALGKPDEEAAYSLTYKRTLDDCLRYSGIIVLSTKQKSRLFF